MEIVVDGADHDFPRIHANADLHSRFFGLAGLLAVAAHLLLHGQGCITCAQRVVLMG